MKKLIIAFILIASVAGAKNTTSTQRTKTWAHKGKSFKVEKSSHGKSWRYVHDGTRLVVVPFESNGETTTRGKLVTLKTWKEVKKRLKLDDPKLTITDEQMKEIERIDSEQVAK